MRLQLIPFLIHVHHSSVGFLRKNHPEERSVCIAHQVGWDDALCDKSGRQVHQHLRQRLDILPSGRVLETRSVSPKSCNAMILYIGIVAEDAVVELGASFRALVSWHVCSPFELLPLATARPRIQSQH